MERIRREEKKKEKDGKETLKGEGSKERVEVMGAGKVEERTQGVERKDEEDKEQEKGKKMERRS